MEYSVWALGEKGREGIAVFDDEHNHGYRLKHYFDVSDTHGSRFERSVPIWSMKPEYEAEVIESLENSFGELDDKSTFAYAIADKLKKTHLSLSARLPSAIRHSISLRQ